MFVTRSVIILENLIKCSNQSQFPVAVKVLSIV